MARKIKQSVLLQTVLCLSALSWLAVKIPRPLPSSHPEAQTTAIRIPINVNNAALPITIGVPISEGASLLDAAQLGVVDASGASLPTQTRVLARWRGGPNDASRPIKWLLVDFKATASGTHYLTRASRGSIRPATASDTADSLRVANSQLEIEFPKQGEALVKSFKLDGAEQLRAPATMQAGLPRAALINHQASALGLGPDSINVTDPSLFKVGETIRFEHVDALKWEAPAGSARIVIYDQSFVANRRYRVEEGTPRQEDVEVNWSEGGDLRTTTALRFNHAVGSRIRDLGIEQETPTIKKVSGQVIQFTAPLTVAHVPGERVFVPNSANQIAAATIERAAIEEANPLRIVVRQDGRFKSAAGTTPATVAFTLRYYIYADQPFIRARLRLMNNGIYGFGADRTGQPPFSQHALFRSLSVMLPTATAGSGAVQVLSSTEARSRMAQKQNSAALSAGTFEFAVPEFVENFPKALQGNASGLRFDILPDLGSDYIVDGARAKTTDFYFGRGAAAARSLTNMTNAKLNPSETAKTGAVRPVFVEKRNWAGQFGAQTQLSEASTRIEKMFASAYAVEAGEPGGSIPPMSIFEYRQSAANAEMYGWRNFGDLSWDDGYANVHYDLPFVVLREYLRTGDPRAFQIGGEMARYRADWGHYRADDYIDREHIWNFKGMAFYEKGDHGTYREPVPSHMWIEGMWLYWALTGDESVHESAVEAADAFARMNLTYESALSWNESRWLGWPTLGLMVAYRYSGDPKYLDKVRANVNVFLQTEENYGRKGYYLNRAPGVIQGVQTWMWGFALLGVIEYWRDTGDQRAADFIVRVADWMISKNSNNPPLLPGRQMPDGTYLPAGVSYMWYPDKVAEDRSLALAGLCLPVLTTAARITKRADLQLRAQELFRDYAFYRDLPEGKSVPPSTRAVINFRSLQFPGSVPKVYGQMGLTVADYLPDLTDLVASGVKLGNFPSPSPTPPTAGTVTGRPLRSSPSTPTGPTPVNSGGPTNVALNRPAMASSFKVWPNALGQPSAANDGQISVSGKASIWHSDSNTGRAEWWQVDLGQSYRVSSLEIAFREDEDQPNARRFFEVRGSNDPNFKTSTLLGGQGESPVPFRQVWKVNVSDAGSYRFFRVQKSRVDPDSGGQSFFCLAEVRVFAQPTSTNRTLRVGELAPQKVLVGQTLGFTLARTDENGLALQLYALSLPANASFNQTTGEFRFMPTSAQAGNVYQIGFREMNAKVDRSARLDVNVAIDGAPALTLLAPTPATRLATNQPALISWTAAGSSTIAKYQVRLSTDGGASYPTVLADLPGNVSQYRWLVPKNFPLIDRSLVRVMVRGTDSQNRAGIDFSQQDLRVSLGVVR